MIRYRLNAVNIDNITDFGRIRGQRTGDIRQVYLVKFVGADSNIRENVRALKNLLKAEQDIGRVYYKYIDNIEAKHDYSEYQSAYDRWVGDKTHIDLKIIKLNKMAESDLINAIIETEKILYSYKKNVSPSIIRNTMVKLLCWFEEKFINENIKIAGERSIKIICENIIKESQVYFFVFLNLLGMDVCMLQYAADKDILNDYFHIKRLGDFCQCDSIWLSIPEEVKDIAAPGGDKGANKAKERTVPVTISFESTRKKDKKTAIPSKGGESKRIAPEITNPKKEAPTANVIVPSSENPTPVVIPPRREPSATAQRPAESSSFASVPHGNKELSYVELAKLSSSIVMIKIYDGSQKILGTGSGIMLGKYGFILTNCHVISGGDLFEVRIEDDDNTYKTKEVIKYNQHLDLAIIRISRLLKPLRLYSGREPLVRGQKVVAIGSPLGLFNSVSDGIISGFRNIENVDMIQFSAPISPGSSGGAVLNMHGEVIGISTAGFSEGQNINLAVPYIAIWDFAGGFI